MSRPEITPEEFEKRRLKFYRKIGSDISKHGQSVLFIFPTEEDPGLPFFYSIDLTQKQLPELLVICAMRPEFGQAAINTACDQLRERGSAFPEGAQLDIGFVTPVRIHTPTDQAMVRSTYTIQVGRFFKRETYQVQQIYWPDKNGHWPGEAGYNQPEQLLLP